MREEIRRQVRELYTNAARFSGVVIAIVAVWFGGLLIARLLAHEAVGEVLLVMSFCLVMAIVLLSVSAEKPRDSENKRSD